MIRAEGTQRPMGGREVAHEAFEHGFMLDDRPRRECAPVGSGRFRALPLLVCFGRCRQPDSRFVHSILYTEYRAPQA